MDDNSVPVLPLGYRVAGVSCGLKTKLGTPDLGVVLADGPCVAAGVYTQNQVFAAPVELDRSRTPSDQIRGIVFNSGCANACTGVRGLENATEMAEHLGRTLGFSGRQALVMSTGIIGHHLDMDKVRAGITQASAVLGRNPPEIDSLSRALMTTDTYPKRISRSLRLAGETITITGFAKGAGMIGPNMATMLGVILTDAKVSMADAAQLLPAIADRSFNAISVDGHTSTNDTLLLLANGGANAERLMSSSPEFSLFRELLQEIATYLARQIANDGEGATHLVEIRVSGAKSFLEAREMAASVANSPLVKTAIAGCDPNWGRIVSAAGYSAARMQTQATTLRLNGTLLYQRGEPYPFDAAAVSQSMRDNRDVVIELVVGEGEGEATFWTCDLTTEYVHINADYHT
jgi:glutamate N-acetyltransferase / amino-acid N-acetyltransferase